MYASWRRVLKNIFENFSMRLFVNPEMATHDFHSDSATPVALCEVPDESGRARSYIVPLKLLTLLPACDGQKERSDAVAQMSADSEGNYSPEQINRLLDQFLIPRNLLLDADSAEKPKVAAPRLDRYLFFKFRFLKHGIVSALANKLQFLFSPATAKAALLLIPVTHLWFYLVLQHGRAPQLNSLTNSSLPWILALFSFSGLLHEFGHAAALTRFGGKRAEIGFCMYICFAALFVDLSDGWRLTNRQRVIVDLSGMYFQGILLIFIAAAYAITGWPSLAYCFVFTDIQIFTNLNPLLRLDGYWALADALGIPNLRSRSRRYLFAAIPQMSSRALWMVRVYVVCSVLFSFYLGWAIARQCLSVLQSYPGLLKQAVESWHAAVWLNAASLSFAVVWRGVLLIGVVLMIVRAVLWILSFGKSKGWSIS
jgi:putative peptide zinc metalloprotease protein